MSGKITALNDHVRHLRGLQAFDVAATCGSLSKAAEELGVTHGAISRQIKLLEDHLDVSLFHRRPNGVEITEQGLHLHEATRQSFQLLREGVRRVKRAEDNQSITISLSASLATKWLVSRLPAFREANPGLAIYLDTNDEIIDMQNSQVDVALRYGRPDWRRLHYELFLREELVVVAAPRYVDGHSTPMNPETISLLPRLSDEFNPAWDRWAADNGLDPAGLAAPAVRFADSAVLITAAIDGQGAALVRRLLVEDDLSAGRLIRLDRTVTASDRSLYFVCRSGDRNRAPVRRFRNWLFSLGLN